MRFDFVSTGGRTWCIVRGGLHDFLGDSTVFGKGYIHEVFVCRFRRRCHGDGRRLLFVSVITVAAKGKLDVRKSDGEMNVVLRHK